MYYSLTRPAEFSFDLWARFNFLRGIRFRGFRGLSRRIVAFGEGHSKPALKTLNPAACLDPNDICAFELLFQQRDVCFGFGSDLRYELLYFCSQGCRSEERRVGKECESPWW